MGRGLVHQYELRVLAERPGQYHQAQLSSGYGVVGLVGKIEAVTASAARVKLITDSTSMINVIVTDVDADCMLQGSITGDVTIEMVSQDVKLEPGQVIQTSGLGGEFPADFIVGQVLNVNQINNEIFQSASVLPAEDFNSLQAVLVVSNFSPANTAPLE